MRDWPTFHSLADHLVCENCKAGYPKKQMNLGYKTDLKIWCRSCRVGKNYVANKCDCTARGCYCVVGFPWELLCTKCRDDRHPGDVNLFCVCPPNEEIYDRWQSEDEDEGNDDDQTS